MRIVIADDELLLRQGLRWVLELRDHWWVVEEVADADAITEAVTRLQPDMLITDIRMPPGDRDDGLVAAIRARRLQPSLSIVVLSQHLQRAYARELLAAPGAGRPGSGGIGYLLKQRIADVERFRDALRSVASGATVLDPEVVALAASSTHRRGRVLTPRQHEVMGLVARGYSNARIAAELNLTERAVVKHVSRIYDVLGLSEDGEVNRRVAAVTRYLAD